MACLQVPELCVLAFNEKGLRIMNIKTCEICQKELNLSRREIDSIVQIVKKIKRERYFVPEDEVFAVIHKFHSDKEVQCPKT